MPQFTNQAALTYNGITTLSNTTVGQLNEVLLADKYAIMQEYQRGDTVTYILNIVNSGASSFEGVTVTDNLGTTTVGTLTTTPLTYVTGSVEYYAGGVRQAAAPTVTLLDTSMTVGPLTIPANSDGILIYQAKLNSFAPLAEGDGVTNTATISGGGIATPLETGVTVLAASAPYLTITKNLNPTSVVDNTQVTYTFVIENTGNTAVDASTAVVVSDTFNPALTNIAVSYNGTAWTTDSYTYNETTGVFETVSGQITVDAATFTQDTATGEWIITPGIGILTVTGKV